jgi:hypothetical protein
MLVVLTRGFADSAAGVGRDISRAVWAHVMR